MYGIAQEHARAGRHEEGGDEQDEEDEKEEERDDEYDLASGNADAGFGGGGEAATMGSASAVGRGKHSAKTGAAVSSESVEEVVRARPVALD